MDEFRIADFKVGDLDSLFYVPDFVSEAEEKQLSDRVSFSIRPFKAF